MYDNIIVIIIIIISQRKYMATYNICVLRVHFDVSPRQISTYPISGLC